MINPMEVISQTEKFYRIRQGLILTKSRKHTVAEARAVAIYVTRKLTEYSSTELAEYYFKTDHSAILRSSKKIQDVISKGEKTNCYVIVDKLLELFLLNSRQF